MRDVVAWVKVYAVHGTLETHAAQLQRLAPPVFIVDLSGSRKWATKKRERERGNINLFIKPK